MKSNLIGQRKMDFLEYWENEKNGRNYSFTHTQMISGAWRCTLVVHDDEKEYIYHSNTTQFVGTKFNSRNFSGNLALSYFMNDVGNGKINLQRGCSMDKSKKFGHNSFPHKKYKIPLPKTVNKSPKTFQPRRSKYSFRIPPKTILDNNISKAFGLNGVKIPLYEQESIGKLDRDLEKYMEQGRGEKFNFV